MNYSKAPITEAVIELRFSEDLSFEDIQKRIDKFKKLYPQESRTVAFTGEMSERGFSGTQEPIGIRLSTGDELQVLVINKNNFTVSQLAPYVGWDNFFARFIRDLDLFLDKFGNKNFVRIGMRYINRVDVPLERVTVSDYLRVYPEIPDLGKVTAKSFALQSTQDLGDGQFGVTLQTANVDSPVPGAISFLLDIDLFTNNEVPRRRDRLVEVMHSMREIKNQVFEASITDKSRELFDERNI